MTTRSAETTTPPKKATKPKAKRANPRAIYWLGVAYKGSIPTADKARLSKQIKALAEKQPYQTISQRDRRGFWFKGGRHQSERQFAFVYTTKAQRDRVRTVIRRAFGTQVATRSETSKAT